MLYQVTLMCDTGKYKPEIAARTKKSLEAIFPELKGDNEEKIRKGIKSILEHYKESGEVVCPYPFVSIDEALAWLEKQGESDETKAKMFLISKGYPIDANGIFPTYEEMYNIIREGFENPGGQNPADSGIEEEKPLLEKFKQAVYDCAWGKVTCKKEGETKEEYANRWAEQFLLMVREWADDYIDSREYSIKRRAYDKGKQDCVKKIINESKNVAN